jgi:Fe-S cluster assembly iron-binding protein IscA
MLQITSRAAAVLSEERAQRGIPDSFGLRVQEERSNSTGSLRLEFAAAPAPGDEVGETEGVQLFIAPEVADALSEQAIDAADGSLVLRDQGELET